MTFHWSRVTPDDVLRACERRVRAVEDEHRRLMARHYALSLACEREHPRECVCGWALLSSCHDSAAACTAARDELRALRARYGLDAHGRELGVCYACRSRGESRGPCRGCRKRASRLRRAAGGPL